MTELDELENAACVYAHEESMLGVHQATYDRPLLGLEQTLRDALGEAERDASLALQRAAVEFVRAHIREIGELSPQVASALTQAAGAIGKL